MASFYRIMMLGLAALGLSACAEAAMSPTSEIITPSIVVDQFGYLPALEKRAIIRSPEIGFDAVQSFTPGGRYAVINVKSGQSVYDGVAVSWKKGAVDKSSGDKTWWFDFTALTTPGDYLVRDIERGVDSPTFTIGNDVYNPVLKTAFKTLYYQRAGFAKSAPYAAKGYRDGASHIGKGQDGEARLFSAKDDASTARDLRGGWYDAGDYNKYTNWTANYVNTLLHSYIENPSVWTDDFDIPESGNGIPDILDEIKWGLDWLERMQNDDGSMLSVMSLDEGSPPSSAKGPSFYGPENTSATLTSAGAFAFAAQLMGDFPALSGQAKIYQRRAKRAWDWAEANPDVIFKNNDEGQGSLGLAAGQQEVDDKGRTAKRMVAAAYLSALTGERAYARVVEQLYNQTKPIDPYFMNGFEGEAIFALVYFAKDAKTPRSLSRQILSDFGSSVSQSSNGMKAVKSASDGYGAPMTEYTWGSNSVKARTGSFFTQSIIAGVNEGADIDSLNAASHYLHYIHGVNPLGKVYLTNMGALGTENSVDTLYHAWFVNDSKDYDSVRGSTYGPLPGLLVGGPNPYYSRDKCCASECGGYGDKICKRPELVPPSGQPPAKSYADFNEGWPLNSWEVTENSNGYQVAYIRLLSKFAN